MGEAKPSQHAGFVEICVAVCRPEFMARSSQLYYFMVSPGHAQATDLLTVTAGSSRALWANPERGDGSAVLQLVTARPWKPGTPAFKSERRCAWAAAPGSRSGSRPRHPFCLSGGLRIRTPGL